ncbi:MAG: prenyltransferase/squalene oxidase repeat-containing protein [Planctomycetota bacterium]
MKTVLCVTLLALAVLACGEGKPVPPGDGGEDGAAPATGIAAGYDKGLDFLKTRAKDGNYGDPGFTAIAVTPFLTRPGGVRPEDREFIDKGIAFLLENVKENGGIYGRGVANYSTCVSIMALVNDDPEKHKDAIGGAVKFVKSLQAASGGIGYSDKTTKDDPDLSNTQFAIEALRKAGVEKDDPTFSHALKFLQSIQNRSETNPGEYKLEDGRWIVPMDDGGAFYKPTESKAGAVENPDGTVSLRSYGSTTYAMLKCYLMAGLDASDGRVKDALKWVANHYTLEENPGFDTSEDPKAGMQGYFYYLVTMAKALDALGADEVKDADGVEVDWKAELGRELLARQKEDGSWVNEDMDRWLEGKPVLATAYALTALSYCTD